MSESVYLNDYSAAQEVAMMAATVAKRLGHKSPADYLTPFDTYFYKDGSVAIRVQDNWTQIEYKPAGGYFGKVFTFGSMLAVFDLAALNESAWTEHIKSLYTVLSADGLQWAYDLPTIDAPTRKDRIVWDRLY